MMNIGSDTQTPSSTRKSRGSLYAGVATSLFPMLMLALPSTAHAASAVNTATVTAPAGSIEANTGNNSATDTDNVLAAIIATNDTATGINGATGATAVANAFTGDTLNGAPATASNATLSVTGGTTVPAGLTFNTATGAVDVASGTPAGSYVVNYTICETLNPTNCKEATITVDVVAAPVAADPDTVTGVNGATGANDVLDVLDGDTLNGAPVSLATVTLSVLTPATPVTPGAPVPALGTDGNIDVPVGTPAGTYTITYQICEILNPTNCATNTATVTVAPSPIVATNDTATGISGASGATAVANAFTGDTINGAPATASNATLSVTGGTTIPAGLTFNTATGAVDVAPGTPAGSHVVNYTICEILNPTNCRNATITVEVVAAPVVATNDSITGINGVTGAASVLNVLTGDTINGVAATTSTATLSVAAGSSVPPQLSFNPATGAVGVNPNTPAGTYSFDYQICETLNPTNCRTATATATVSPSVDLSVVKSNGTTSVFSGSTTTYTLIVTNSGPDAATGALIKDTPDAGLTCPATNSVTISGNGVPSGSFTIADLTGTGIVLGTLGNGQSATITYSCQVN